MPLCTTLWSVVCLSIPCLGLPAEHWSYVKNIEPSLPLFLFNYSDRKLHGIFEAASSGQMNINPYAWTDNGSRRTQYPAQVQIHICLQCHPLREEQFKPIIAENYYIRNHFWFELDHAQTSKLTSLLASLAVTPGSSIPENTTNWISVHKPLPVPKRRDEGFTAVNSLFQNQSSSKTNSMDASSLAGKDRPLQNQLDIKMVEQDHEDLLLKELQELAHNNESKNLPLRDCVDNSATVNDMCLEEKGPVEEQMHLGMKNDETPCTSSNCQYIIAQLVQGMEELKAFKREQMLKMCHLEQKLAVAEEQIQKLKDRCMMLESLSNPSMRDINNSGGSSFDDLDMDPTNTASNSFDDLDLDTSKSIYLVGGYDGESWLSSLDLYFPENDVLQSLKPMSTVRSYASTAKLNDEVYVFGGGSGNLWYDSVESYNPANDQWTLRPNLTEKKGSLGGATLKDKIFAIGGGNGLESFSSVEMLDFDVGRWIRTRSMLQKRFALAAVEFNSALYATGGFDGNDYLKSAERFDPREHCWTRIASMNTKRGCHSLVVLNEKLYALGGFDGNTMVQSTEVFDPRLDLWVEGEPMNKSRGYSAAAVVGETIYVMGGLRSDENILDTVEHFKEGQGWQENMTTAVRKRCFLSAVVL
ncbi:uncharacterized protein LOC105648083 isoform X2 [Jatropha curcas]|uniref:uncharacterized protein LOC105648083 isoform X2 n=1 Tax=Jatropha curcas TaxID=180498 RepID=UPI0009D68312|nr:uncharacterized protein LOC105648083 isoform X2 [Jatropha curcas]